MEARELFRQGLLDRAIEAMNSEVRQHPSDADRRSYLCDLLCLSGSFDRADVQLEAISKLVPGAMAGIALRRQLVRAETWRQQCFADGRVPEFLELPGERLGLHLRALAHLRAGEAATAATLLNDAEGLRPAIRGTCNGKTIEDFRDVDDTIGGVLELLTSTGKYYWVPLERVRRLELRPIERPRDLRWRRAGVEIDGGPDGEVYLPAIYAPAPESEEARLGRTTTWSDDEPIRGSGLRVFLAGEEAVTLHELQTLEFPSPEGR
jgi:type VI secretion system protein ImpE